MADAQAYCRNLARTHYENFPIVSWLLPRRLQQHFYNVYAYCRWADDLGDEVGDRERSLELLSWWRQQLAECYANLGGRHVRQCGQLAPRVDGPLAERADHIDPSALIPHLSSAPHPVFVALQKTIAECGIPRQPFEDLISAFEQDQRVRNYETFPQLLEYCRRSANPVGRLVLYVCGEFDEQRAVWADSICTGLQLANFWQDVRRDSDIGRVYLPREDREQFGYAQEDLEKRVTNAAFLELMRFEVERARRFLLDGLPLVECLPGRLQVDVELFARGGLAILERIESIGYRVWDRRPVVTKGDIASLFLQCVGRAVWRRLLGRDHWSRLSRGNSSP